MTTEQQQLLVNIVGENYINLACKRRTLAKKRAWELITKKCNWLGPIKTTQQWKKCWFDLKKKSKVLLKRRRQNNNRTGVAMIEFPPINQKILEICQERLLDGYGSLLEFGIRSIPTVFQESLLDGSENNNIFKSETSLDIYDNIDINVDEDYSDSDSDQNTTYSMDTTDEAVNVADPLLTVATTVNVADPLFTFATTVNVADPLLTLATTSNVKIDKRILSTDNMTLIQEDVDDLKSFLISLYNPIKNLPEQAQFEITNRETINSI